jgi:hypothetical protein
VKRPACVDVLGDQPIDERFERPVVLGIGEEGAGAARTRRRPARVRQATKGSWLAIARVEPAIRSSSPRDAASRIHR